MELQDFSFGKKISNTVYFHRNAICSIPNTIQEQLNRTLSKAADYSHFNVIKLDLKNNNLSLLKYEHFTTSFFPKLIESASTSLNDKDGLTWSDRSYNIENPPILHRKELLLPPDHPDIPKFAALTKQLEDAGLFKDSRKIGYKKQWEERLRNAGYKVIDHKLVKLDGSEIALPQPQKQTSQVERHRTALTRYALSKPMQILSKYDFLEGKHTIFDYGCGKGSDVNILNQNDIIAHGWDPYFCPENDKHEADIVNLGFVINVIEDKDERAEAVLGAYRLCKQFLCAAVMLGESSPDRGRLYSDGVLTKRNTFQKYFSQEEFRGYLQYVLDEEPVAVGSGIFFIFKDKDAEQAFLERRYCNRGNANRLIQAIPRPTRAEKEQEFYRQHAEKLDALWLRWIELGRPPQKDECQNTSDIIELLGTWKRALNFLKRFHGDEILQQAFDSRRDDLTIYFAMRRFEAKRVYRNLPESLKRDVKAFFNNYQNAQQAGENLLFSAGNSEVIKQLCKEAAEQGYGYLDEKGSLTFHTSQAELLPPLLRVYIGCATQVFGDITNVDLLKIHSESGKLSLMKYDDFEGSALPRMLERIKINLVNQRFDYYKYGEEYASPYLYLKSRFISSDYPNHEEQTTFDKQLQALETIDLSGYGMEPGAFDNALRQLRLEVKGLELVPSTIIPDLDDPCGQYFTFRDFIECGETQAKTELPNLPKQVASYNALSALASHIIDPVVDYFGGIELTYGFCSRGLAKHIPGRIDPSRDQHASHEINTRGNLICKRLGAACDFIVQDESMLEVAQWIVENTPFDRLYFYGDNKPIHVSYGAEQSRAIVLMLPGKTGNLIPKVEKAEQFLRKGL